jgi:pyridoxal phosphate enzyme (YggS family)
MTSAVQRVAENLESVRGRIVAAAARSGRTADAISLVVATKYVTTDLAAAVITAGCRDLGESRPQELWAKATALPDPAIRWHLIGHLQRNKIRRTLPLVSLIHSIDSQRLLAAINEEAKLAGRIVPILLEVNISGDAAKTGLAPEELEPLVAEASALEYVEVRGLMGMAGLEGDDTVARRDFIRLRTLRDRLARNLPPQFTLDDLSMGMSGDFEIAIEEGATIVRLGSLLFEGVEP